MTRAFLLSVVIIFAITINLILESSLQCDFSAYYFAGRSYQSNLNPYENNLPVGIQYWDGVNNYAHSRYIYSPIALPFFSLLSNLNYQYAKVLFTILSIVSTLIATRLFLSKYCEEVGNKPKNLIPLIIFIVSYFPFVLMIERGQIEGVLLLLIAISYRYYEKINSSIIFIGTPLVVLLVKANYGLIFSGIFRGKDILLKHVVAIVLFSILLVIIMPASTVEYVNELPRILKYKEMGPDSLRLSNKYLLTMSGGHGLIDTNNIFLGYAHIANYDYKVILFNNEITPSLWNLSHKIANKFGYSTMYVSWLLLTCLFVILVIVNRLKTERYRKFSIVLLVVCLLSPYTWESSLVLLIPIIVLISQRDEHDLISILGLVLIAIPNYSVFRIDNQMLIHLFNAKYILGMLLVGYSVRFKETRIIP